MRITGTVVMMILTLLSSKIIPLASDQSSTREWFVKIGFRKQLLVDDYAIAERRNVTRELGQVTKANAGKPIFTDCWDAMAVLHDGGIFKMWYTPKDQDFSDEVRLKSAYAESKDGLHWTKKADVITTATGGAIVHGVSLDPHEKDPKHRYKGAYHPTNPPYGACLAHSTDGISWTPYNEGKPVTYRAADYPNQIFWDEEVQVYRLFTRTDFGDPGGPGEDRGTRMMINPDVRADPTNWTTIRSWKFDLEGPEEYKRRQIYGLRDWIYEGIHFALITVYEWPGFLHPGEGPHDAHRRHERDIMNFYIATSRDADNWDLSWVYASKPMIPRGPDGSFDKDAVYQYSPIVTHQDKHWFYYSGGLERHNSGYDSAHARDNYVVGLATLRLDGFVCLEAKDQPGTVITKPLKLEGSKLEVNADAQNGELSVEILDAPQTGTPIPGFTQKEAKVFRGVDELRLRPSWNNHADLAALKDKVVRLKFHLRSAKLYAFQVLP